MRPVACFIALGIVACSSPEADRERGGAGADAGNRDPIVEIHQGAEPYHDTPCRMSNVECPKLKSEAEQRRATGN